MWRQLAIEIQNLIELNQISPKRKQQEYYFYANGWEKSDYYTIWLFVNPRSTEKKYYVQFFYKWNNVEKTWNTEKGQWNYFSTKEKLIEKIEKIMKKVWFKSKRKDSEIGKLKNIIYDKETKELTLDWLNELLVGKEELLSKNEKKELNKVHKRLKNKAKTEENLRNYNIWDIIVTSWGYDQTNVNAYQIINIKNKTVNLREISTATLKDSWNFDQVKPIKNSFRNEKIITKRITARWISIQWHGWDLWDWKRSYYRSWVH